MKPIKKLLVPTDFSKNSEIAYTHAQKIADKFGATIDLIHIIPTLRYFHESLKRMSIPLDMENDLYPHITNEVRHKLQKVTESYIREENRGQVFALVDRKPATAIVGRAKQGNYDLIVMAARGEHESDLLRGGVTERVIRHSEVPVFTVDDRLSAKEIRRLLVPTDASPTSFSAFDVAAAFAGIYNGEITLFHVQELYGSISDGIRTDYTPSEKEVVYENIIQRLESYLKNKKGSTMSIQRGSEQYEDLLVVKNGASSSSIPLHTVIERGISAHYEIENYASNHADIIVMATHGHTGLAHFFLGSTAEKVAQYVKMPVLTVRPEEIALKE